MPGPGEYPIDSFNPTGHYPLSQNRSAVNICFAASKSRRFVYQGKYKYYDKFHNVDSKVPGPGQYESKSVINGNGTHFNSKIKGSPAKSILGRSNTRNTQAGQGIFIQENNNNINYSAWTRIL